MPRTPNPFSRSDYPEYDFLPDGTPVRKTPATRGPTAGDPNRQPRPRIHGGSTYFQIKHASGNYRTVSRNRILESLFPENLPESKPRDPSALPPRYFVIPGYDDYAVKLYPPSVVRFYNPNFGQLEPPLEIKCSERKHRTATRDYLYVGFVLQNPESGTRNLVTWDKILDLCGFTPADVASEQTRHLSGITHSLSAL